MRQATSLLRLTVVKKILMAVTGLMLFGFVIGHMLGNWKMFLGEEAYNHYAEGLRHLGDPFFPETGVLWLFRIGLLLAVGIHAYCAVDLAVASRAARPEPYTEPHPKLFSAASSTMLWGGITLAVFVVYHLLHLTFGSAHGDFIAHNPYHNVVSGFQRPLVSLVYLAAMVPLGLHLYHGLWSMCQTLGLNHPKINDVRRPLAAAIAILITGGNMIMPLAVLVGIVS